MWHPALRVLMGVSGPRGWGWGVGVGCIGEELQEKDPLQDGLVRRIRPGPGDPARRHQPHPKYQDFRTASVSCLQLVSAEYTYSTEQEDKL